MPLLYPGVKVSYGMIEQILVEAEAEAARFNAQVSLEAIERFDEFEAALDTLRGALECVDLASGELHRPEHIEALIAQVARRIESLGVGESTKLAKYLVRPGMAGFETERRERQLRHLKRQAKHFNLTLVPAERAA